MFEPAYIRTYESGQLKKKVEEALTTLQSCSVCPHECGVNRLTDEQAICRTGRLAIVSSWFAHFGEENCLRGWGGSGTIFFSNCNLKCVFCQNHDISQRANGKALPAAKLADIMLALQSKGCHNINFVTPEHVVPQILESLLLAIRQGLRLPLVYNTGAYDSLESIQLLEGVVDIYMPDFKFWDTDKADRYLKVCDYPEIARQVIKEMHHQVGDLVIDSNGLACRGLLLRHLVMPDDVHGTQAIMHWLTSEVSPDTHVNLMDQYRPSYKAARYPEINRPITVKEYRRAENCLLSSGLQKLP